MHSISGMEQVSTLLPVPTAGKQSLVPLRAIMSKKLRG